MNDIFLSIYMLFLNGIFDYPFVTIPILILLTCFAAFPGFLSANLHYIIRRCIKYSIIGLTIIAYSVIINDLESAGSSPDFLAGLLSIMFSSPLLISSAILIFVRIKNPASKNK